MDTTVLNIVQIVFFLCISVLALYLINALSRLLKSIKNIEENINILIQRAMPVIEHASTTMRRVDELSSLVQREVENVVYAIRSLKKIADDILEFENKIKMKVEEPILDTVSFFSGIIKGLKTFITKLKS